MTDRPRTTRFRLAPEIDARLLLRAVVVQFAPWAGLGLFFTAAILVVSLFRSGELARVTRAVSVAPIVTASAIGAVRALHAVVVLLAARRRRGSPDR